MDEFLSGCKCNLLLPIIICRRSLNVLWPFKALFNNIWYLHYRGHRCGIQYGKYFFGTGGTGSGGGYDAFRIEMDSIYSLVAMSSLNEGRRNHGCTSFVDSGVTKVIILVFNG